LNWSPRVGQPFKVEPGVTIQPASKTFDLNRVPDCPTPISFMFVTQSLSFVSLTSLTATGGNVSVTGATLLDLGSYLVKLRAYADQALNEDSFTI